MAMSERFACVIRTGKYFMSLTLMFRDLDLSG